jgi:hypothetical protein
MPSSRILIPLALLSLLGGLARAEEPQSLIERPITLARGAIDLTLHGTYTNWGTGATVFGAPGSLTGETLALGADFGVNDQAQLGLGVALPINPGAGFGSLFASAAFALDKRTAVRVDAGYESVGLNGDSASGSNHASRYFAGLGAPLKVPLGPTLAFVTGRTGAVHFGHFNNIGPVRTNGTGFYVGASLLTEAASDFVVFSTGGDNSGSNLGFNLPAGLLLQPGPRFAVTLQAGYSAAISFPQCPAISTTCKTQALHFIPVGLEAVVSPVPQMDIGGRFFLDGYVAQTGGSSSGAPSFFDLRALMFWFRFHT